MSRTNKSAVFDWKIALTCLPVHSLFPQFFEADLFVSIAEHSCGGTMFLRARAGMNKETGRRLYLRPVPFVGAGGGLFSLTCWTIQNLLIKIATGFFRDKNSTVNSKPQTHLW